MVIRSYCLDVVSPCPLEAGTMGRTSAVSVQHPGMLWLALCGPRRVLEYDPIPIEILERLPLCFPIGIIRRDTLEPRCEHASTTGFPLALVRDVEDQQMILGRNFADVVSTLGRELQMVGLLGMSEDDAVKTVMVMELGEHREI